MPIPLYGSESGNVTKKLLKCWNTICSRLRTTVRGTHFRTTAGRLMGKMQRYPGVQDLRWVKLVRARSLSPVSSTVSMTKTTHLAFGLSEYESILDDVNGIFLCVGDKAKPETIRFEVTSSGLVRAAVGIAAASSAVAAAAPRQEPRSEPQSHRVGQPTRRWSTGTDTSLVGRDFFIEHAKSMNTSRSRKSGRYQTAQA